MRDWETNNQCLQKTKRIDDEEESDYELKVDKTEVDVVDEKTHLGKSARGFRWKIKKPKSERTIRSEAIK